MRDEDIYLINPDGTGQIKLTYNSDTDLFPEISPDGTKIAFGTSRDGDDEIYTIDIDGANPTNISNDGITHDTYPSWSPDGTKIAVQRYDGAQFDIYTLDSTSGAVISQLTNDVAVDVEPRWSPDGSKIAWECRINDGGANREVCTINADGTGGYTNISNNAAIDSTPAWSPDGSEIVFRTNRGGQDIYKMNADGSNQIALTQLPATHFSPTYSPDGSKIAFLKDLGLYSLDPDATPFAPHTEILPDNEAPQEFYPDWGLISVEKTWDGLADGEWNIDGNWDPFGVPTPADDVFIPSGSTVQANGATIKAHKITNDGFINAFTNIELYGIDPSIVSNTGGSIQLNVVNVIPDLAFATVTHGAGHLIYGYGTILDNKGDMINDGTLRATGILTLDPRPGGSLTNNGELRSGPGIGQDILEWAPDDETTQLDNTNGQIIALDGELVRFDGGIIIDGELLLEPTYPTGTGMMEVTSNPRLYYIQ